MFNNSYRQKIISLEDALSRQAVMLSEKDSELKNLQQKLAYNEGMIQTLNEMISMLKNQVAQESARVQALQETVLSQLTVSSDKFPERFANIYAEDEEIVNEMRKEYLNEEGDL